jgi:uncharacterized protein (DUF305 family)
MQPTWVSGNSPLTHNENHHRSLGDAPADPAQANALPGDASCCAPRYHWLRSDPTKPVMNARRRMVERSTNHGVSASGVMRMELRKTRTVALAALLVVSASGAQAPHQHEILSQGAPSPGIAAESFTSLMMQIMERMHRDMSTVPSGNPDRDFAAMMIPHHQGAVDMAKIELQFGKSPVLRRLAQGIIVEQLQEIEVMQRELRQLAPALKEP